MEGEWELNLGREPNVLLFGDIQLPELAGKEEGEGNIWRCIRKFLTISVYIDFIKHHVCEFLSCHRIVAAVDSSDGLQGEEDTRNK